MEILAGENLFSFFYDRVGAARKSLGTDVDEHTEFYLVNLLVDFQRTGKLVEVSGSRVDDRPLAIRLLQTRHAQGQERVRLLKHLADSTLYMLGYFAASLRRSTVNLRYYAGVGESAYEGLAEISDGRSEGAGSVYRQLADRFTDCAEILSEVRDDVRSDRDLLALYEQWLAFGEERALRKLKSLGVVPLADEPGTLH